MMMERWFLSKSRLYLSTSLLLLAALLLLLLFHHAVHYHLVLVHSIITNLVILLARHLSKILIDVLQLPKLHLSCMLLHLNLDRPLVVLVLNHLLLLLDVWLVTCLYVGNDSSRRQRPELFLCKGQMFPSDVGQRTHFVHVCLFELVSSRNKMLLSHDI